MNARGIHRRGFLQGAAGFLVASKVEAAKSEIEVELAIKGVPIHQCHTDNQSTYITVVREIQQKFVYKVVTSHGSEIIPEISTHGRDYSNYEVDILSIFDLTLGVDYQLFVATQEGKHIDRRVFRALDIDDEKTRICVLSCLRDSNRILQSQMWDSLKSVSPDVIFCLGDSVYIEDSFAEMIFSEESKPEKIWRRFIESRLRLKYFRAERLIPMVAIWDDHDYGFNGGNESYKFKKESKASFETFFPRGPESERFTRGPGVAFRWDVFGSRFIFLDARYYRRNRKGDVPGTHWGENQKNWLQKEMTESQTPVFLLNGCQFLGDWIRNDSVIRHHPEDLLWLFDRINECTYPVNLFSGDVHYSEIVQIPHSKVNGTLYEITSSAMHTTPGFPFLNSGAKRVAVTGENNFLVMQTLEKLKNQLTLGITSYGDGANELFNTKLTTVKNSGPPNPSKSKNQRG